MNKEDVKAWLVFVGAWVLVGLFLLLMSLISAARSYASLVEEAKTQTVRVLPDNMDNVVVHIEAVNQDDEIWLKNSGLEYKSEPKYLKLKMKYDVKGFVLGSNLHLALLAEHFCWFREDPDAVDCGSVGDQFAMGSYDSFIQLGEIEDVFVYRSGDLLIHVSIKRTAKVVEI